jgi:hypothetical protein
VGILKIIFAMLGMVLLSGCNNAPTPSLNPTQTSLNPTQTLPQKNCKDLSATDCHQSEALIGQKCSWDGKICEIFVNPSPDLNRCDGLTQQQCVQAIMAHGRCEWRQNACLSKLSESENLTSYLEAFRVDSKVFDLAQKGIENYKKPPLLATREHAKNTNATGGGRTSDWIQDTFGKSEAQIVGELKNAPALPTWNLLSIDEAFLAAKTKTPPESAATLPTFFLVKGLSVNYLHDYPQGKNAILQLASQFNFLESPSTSKTNVLNYLGDYTQGPQGSIEAAAAALHRTALEGEGKLLHALHNVLSGDVSAYYTNGYFEPHKISDAEQNNLLTHIKANLKKMTILPQWATCEASGANQLQVFSAAPSYQGAPSPAAGSFGAQLCDELVSAQYEAIAKLAVIRSVSTGGEVPVHFTLVGQGAFNNPASVMANSFKKVAQIVKGYNKIKVYIHGYGAQDQAKIRALVDPTFFTLQELTKEEFQAR